MATLVGREELRSSVFVASVRDGDGTEWSRFGRVFSRSNIIWVAADEISPSPNITYPFRQSIYRCPEPVSAADDPNADRLHVHGNSYIASPTRLREVKLLQNLQIVHHPLIFEGRRNAPVSTILGLRRACNRACVRSRRAHIHTLRNELKVRCSNDLLFVRWRGATMTGHSAMFWDPSVPPRQLGACMH